MLKFFAIPDISKQKRKSNAFQAVLRHVSHSGGDQVLSNVFRLGNRNHIGEIQEGKF